jgi:plasmid maintenance system killer protein
VIKTFADSQTEVLYVTGRSRRLPPDIAKRAVRKLEQLNAATDLADLKVPPSNRLHESGATEKASTRSLSTTSGAFAFGSRTATPTTWRSATTIRKEKERGTR